MPDQSPFDTLEESFRLLCAGPSPLAVDGRELGPPFPRRTIPLTELGGILLHPSTPYDDRDRALRLIAQRSAVQGGRWTVGLAGMLLPGLRVALAPLARVCPASAEELEADTLAALVEAIPTLDLTAEPMAARLVWRITSRAKRRLVRELAAEGRRVHHALPVEPHRPWGHPDFVLAEAVAAEVISPEDAELIGETRLGCASLHAYAQARGVADGALRMRRMRAERPLVAWVGKEMCDEAGFAAPVYRCGSLPGGRPSRARPSLRTRPRVPGGR